jgi:hypothetical protein
MDSGQSCKDVLQRVAPRCSRFPLPHCYQEPPARLPAPCHLLTPGAMLCAVADALLQILPSPIDAQVFPNARTATGDCI